MLSQKLHFKKRALSYLTFNIQHSSFITNIVEYWILIIFIQRFYFHETAKSSKYTNNFRCRNLILFVKYIQISIVVQTPHHPSKDQMLRERYPKIAVMVFDVMIL